MSDPTSRVWPLTALALCLLIAPACQNRPRRAASDAPDPTTSSRPTPNKVPRIARNNPAAEIQGGAQFQRVNALIGQWDLAQSESMVNDAARVADQLRVEVDRIYPDLVAAAEGKRGAATQYLGTSALGFASNPAATQVIARRLYARDERLVGNALVALDQRADPSTPLEPVMKYIDPRAPTLPRRYAPLVLATVYDARIEAGNPIPETTRQTALSRLLGMANDRDGYARLHVTKALGRFGKNSESAVDALILRMSDKQMRVRWGAAAALERTGNHRGFPEVVKLLHDVSPSSKHVIRDVLVSYAGGLQGQPLTQAQIDVNGISAAQWTRWFTTYKASRGIHDAPTTFPSGS